MTKEEFIVECEEALEDYKGILKDGIIKSMSREELEKTVVEETKSLIEAVEGLLKILKEEI